jgi:hypothetical protein
VSDSYLRGAIPNGCCSFCGKEAERLHARKPCKKLRRWREQRLDQIYGVVDEDGDGDGLHGPAQPGPVQPGPVQPGPVQPVRQPVHPSTQTAGPSTAWTARDAHAETSRRAELQVQAEIARFYGAAPTPQAPQTASETALQALQASQAPQRAGPSRTFDPQRSHVEFNPYFNLPQF